LTIDDGKYESLASYHLLPGDVILGRRGEIGRCAVVKTDGLICGTGSMIIRPGQKVRSDYLQRVVSFPSFSHALEANAIGVTMKDLNAKIVGSAEVFLPDLKDQDAFITLVSQIEK
jgi:type I restriction enzyme S subunit